MDAALLFPYLLRGLNNAHVTFHNSAFFVAMAIFCCVSTRKVEKIVTRICQCMLKLMATILRKKHSRRSTPSKYKSRKVARKSTFAPVLPSTFMPKWTPENEPLSSYASATKMKKKMEKIKGQVNFNLIS